jgi:hypothetical protein
MQKVCGGCLYIYAAGDEHAGLWVKVNGILEANRLLVFVPYEENNRACVFPMVCGTLLAEHSQQNISHKVLEVLLASW